MLKNVNEELKNKFIECIKDAWSSEKMQEYCIKKAENLVELSNGYIIDIEKPHIETNFCFGYGMYANYEDEELNQAEDMVKVAETSKEYFKSKNLEKIEELIKDLKQSGYVGIYRKYYSQSKDNKLVNFSIFKDSYYMQEAKNDKRLVDFQLLSKNDIDKIIQAYEQVRQSFIKRIDTYLKKYGTSKVNAWSYLRD